MYRPVSLLICVVVSVCFLSGDSLAKDCPPDVVESNVTSCLQDYKEQLYMLQRSSERFFTGVDVEVVRLICSALETSMTCIKLTTKHCPETERRVIENLLSPHLPVRQLCLIKHLFEDYAMNQYCYLKHRPQSEQCFETFNSSTGSSSFSASADTPPNTDDSSTNHRHHSYCRQVKWLSSCVKRHVRKSCHSSAVRLVEPLVSASLPQSVHCSTKEETSTQEAQTNTNNGAASSGSGSISRATASSLRRRDTTHILSALLHHRTLLTPLLIIIYYCSNTLL